MDVLDSTLRPHGRFTITVYEGDKVVNQQVADNMVVDAGIKHLGDILAGVETTNLDLAYIEPDAGVTDPDIGDTDIETPVDGTDLDRLPASAQTRAALSPYEVEISAFIGTTKWVRPFTINKMAVFFGPDETGDLFAIGLLDTPVTITGTQAATITYGVVAR